MKKFLTRSLFLVSLTGIGCMQNYYTDKPITGQIPSIDKTVLEGTKVSSRAASQKEEYPVYERLYDTTWYQTEKEFDDGKLTTETEFVFFNSDSSVFEIEVENGRAERPERDDYAQLTPIAAIEHTSENRPDESDMNAWIIKKVDGEGDWEFEAYWLYQEKILYITEGDSQAEAERKMTVVMDNLIEGDDIERYILSTEPSAM